MKPVLVGELNPYGSDDYFALYPQPEAGSGGRLMRLLGLTPREYMSAFDRTNLCAGSWDAAAAAVRAETLLRERRVVVACGAKVARAFGLEFEPFVSHRAGRCTVLVLPHPSGLNRMWNREPVPSPRAIAAVERATGLLLRKVSILGEDLL